MEIKMFMLNSYELNCKTCWRKGFALCRLSARFYLANNVRQSLTDSEQKADPLR